jgi:hypothetical protein
MRIVRSTDAMTIALTFHVAPKTSAIWVMLRVSSSMKPAPSSRKCRLGRRTERSTLETMARLAMIRRSMIETSRSGSKRS